MLPSATRAADGQALKLRVREALERVERRATEAALAQRLEHAIEATWSRLPYARVPAPVRQLDADIAHAHGPGMLRATWFAIALRAAQRTLDARLPQLSAVAAVHTLDQFTRIAGAIETDSYGERQLSRNDVFLKDLGICRGTLLPAKARLLDINGGIARRSLAFGLPWSLPLGIYALRAGGLRPYFEFHVHTPMLEWFNRAGFEDCCRLAADYLELFPSVCGIVSMNWWMDPRIRTISPHLWYNREIPEAFGARFLRLGRDPISRTGALTRSATRRRLHSEGAYEPQSYLMVWSRADILRWRTADRAAGRAGAP
jgi:hypothetical protein